MKVIGPVHQDGLNIDMYCFIVITTNDIYATIGVEANTNTVIAISLKPYKISLWERFMFKIGYKKQNTVILIYFGWRKERKRANQNINFTYKK